jgi:imidazolonepropionase-like amidohydrolase
MHRLGSAGMSGNGQGTEWILVRELIDGTGSPPQEDVAVGVADGRIVDIRPRADIGHAERVTDHGDCVLAPGLIDAHLHLTCNHPSDHGGMHAWLESATPAQLAMRAVRNAAACLQAGLTTVRDCGDMYFVTLDVRDAIASGWLPGPRILACGVPITTTAGHMWTFGCEADTADEVRRAVLAHCKRGVDVVKVVESGALYTKTSNPFAPQYGLEELRAAAETSHRLGRRVAAHTMCAEGNRLALAAGIDTLEHCFWVDIDGKPDYDPAEIERFAAQDAWAVATFMGIDRVLLPREGDSKDAAEAKLARLSERYRYHREMWQAGVKTVIGTDAGARLTRFEDFYLSMSCAVQALGMSPIDAIRCATQVPAEALGIGEETGTVEVGKRADLLLASGNPAEDVTDLRNVVRVWQGGKLVVDGGRLAGPEPIELRLPEDESTIFSASESKPIAIAKP